MKFETQALSRITFVFIALLSGCLSVPNKEQCKRSLHCARDVSSTGFLVRTGGLFEKPHDIYRQMSEQLTLRQAVLESGGIRQLEQFELRQVPVTEPARTTSPATKQSFPANSLEILESIFGDDQKILNYFEVPNLILIDGYAASESEEPLEYLQDTLSSLNAAIPYPNQRMSEEWYEQDVSDWNLLLAMAEKPFAAYREVDFELSDGVIAKLRSLKVVSNTATDERLLMGTKPSFNVTEKRQYDVLIGLTRSKNPNETVFFHPRLVHQTAIGDVQLHDKDFVFAVRVSDTSLPQSHMSNDDFMIPVTGASEDYNAVQHSTHGRLEAILALVPSAERASDHVFVLSRPVSGKFGSEVFYLPLSVENSEWIPSEDFVRDGQTRPGDSVIFAYAALSPIVCESLIAPIKASFDERRMQLNEGSNCRQILRTEGGYFSRTRTNCKYYSQTVVRNITNIFR
jgi:hypothetical protein